MRTMRPLSSSSKKSIPSHQHHAVGIANLPGEAALSPYVAALLVTVSVAAGRRAADRRSPGFLAAVPAEGALLPPVEQRSRLPVRACPPRHVHARRGTGRLRRPDCTCPTRARSPTERRSCAPRAPPDNRSNRRRAQALTVQAGCDLVAPPPNARGRCGRRPVEHVDGTVVHLRPLGDRSRSAARSFDVLTYRRDVANILPKHLSAQGSAGVSGERTRAEDALLSAFMRRSDHLFLPR